LGDVFLEDFRFGCLWVAKVHHLVEEFVDNDKVIADRFFFEFFEVFGEDFDYFVEEKEDFGGIRVALCEGEEVQIVVSDIEILSQSQKISRRMERMKIYVDSLV
jgi:hypothetical protein